MERKIVGYKEKVRIGIQGNIYELNATLDTGNGGIVPTLGVDSYIIDKLNTQIILNNNQYILENKGETTPLVGNVRQHRPIVRLDFLEIDGEKIYDIDFGLSDVRKNYSTQILLNRDILSKFNLLIDPSKEYTI